LTFSDESFDVVLLKSVFTHMLPPEVHNYMTEISRVLKRAGRAVTTFFLLNTESRRFIEAGGGPIPITFKHGADPLCRIMKPDIPEYAVAHDEHRVRQYFAEARMSPVEMIFGNWCGRPSLVGLQDVIIALKD
jgi:ubiquinone/menaquinone biosynthesis C-methylase UbiE